MALDNIADIYKLSPVQQGMLFHTLFSPASGAYHDQFVMPFGAVDPDLFRRVWQQIVDRHTVLRTSFLWEDLKEPVQVVHRRVELPLAFEDWSDLEPAAQETRRAELQRADRARGFDLGTPPLMRLTLIRRGRDEHWIMWSYHHLLLDGWSVGVLMREVETLLRAALGGRRAALPPARPYRDYIGWLQQQDLAAAEAYWRRRLAGVMAPTPLGIDETARPGEPGALAWRRVLLPQSLTAALKDFARRHRLTLPTVVQAAWAAALARYSGRDDVVYGVTVSGRPPAIRDVDRMVGCFINTLPVRVDAAPARRLLPWLRQLQGDQLELRRFEHSPLVEVRKWSGLPGNLPLFESILVFEGLTEMSLTDAVRYQRTNYPLVLGVVPGGDDLVLGLGYDSGRFKPTAVARLLSSLVGLLASFPGDPEQRLADLRVLTPGQRQQLLREWNGPAAAVVVPPLHELVEAQADATPRAVAARFEGESLTYRELDDRANRLAHRLRGLGVGPEAVTGVCLERSFDLVVTLLAVLKAGGAYLPLDPHLPRERLEYTTLFRSQPLTFSL